jgi:hypothetical protein
MESMESKPIQGSQFLKVTLANGSICCLFYGLRSQSSMMYEEEMEEGDQTVQIPFIMVYISHHKPANPIYLRKCLCFLSAFVANNWQKYRSLLCLKKSAPNSNCNLQQAVTLDQIT